MAEENHLEAHDRGIGEMISKVHDFVVGGGDSSLSPPVAEEDKAKQTPPPPPASASHQLPPASASHQLPPASASHLLPPASASHQLPPASASHQLPPASASHLLPPASASHQLPPKPKMFRLFGRERPVHQVLGGGLPADVILWRDQKISGGVLGFVTAIWILFELLNYHLLTLIGHGLIFALASLFLWSNAKSFINKSPPKIPVVSISEDHTVYLALSLAHDINWTLAFLRNIALGRDLKKFIGAIAGLWIISVVASWVDFLTLFYILSVLLYTVPVLYEKYEDIVDPFAEKALYEASRNFTVIHAKVMEKIPKGIVKDKKQ